MDGLDADAGVIRALVALSLPWAEMVGRAGLRVAVIVGSGLVIATIAVIAWRVCRPRRRGWVEYERQAAPTEFAREMAAEAADTTWPILLEDRPDRAPKPAYGLKFSRDEQARNIPGQDPWSGS